MLYCRRLEQLLVDSGSPVEAVRAALRERGTNPALAASTAREIKVSTQAVNMCCQEGPAYPALVASTAREMRVGQGISALL